MFLFFRTTYLWEMIDEDWPEKAKLQSKKKFQTTDIFTNGNIV